MTKLRVLVGCEFSGIVRDSFRALGHDAYSCDLLPTESDPAFHIQANCLELLADGWDLLIAHPSCTYLCNSGVRWLYGGKGTVRDSHRWQQMVEAATFFRALLNAPIARIAIENPIPHRYALKEIGTPYSQIVQPFWFNEPTQKATCLWLKNLPKLEINCDNDAFGDTPGIEVANILRDIADRVEEGATAGSGFDINGNTVGQYAFQGKQPK